MSVRDYYDTYWERTGYAGNRNLTPPMRDLFAAHVLESDRCLDLGCGDGGLAGGWISEHAGSYLGVDVSATAVEATRAKGLEAELVEDAGSLPFEDASFDVALSVEVLEHLFQPETAVAEMARVLRPGGRAIVTVPNIAYWRNRADLALLGRWIGRGDARSASAPWLDPHLRFFTIKSLGRLLGESGFELIAAGGICHSGILQSIPGLRKLSRSPAPGPGSRALARMLPGLFASGTYAVGVRPG